MKQRTRNHPEQLLQIISVLAQSKFSFELNLHNLANAERELRVRFGNSPNSNAERRSAFVHAKFGSKLRSECRMHYIGVRDPERRSER